MGDNNNFQHQGLVMHSVNDVIKHHQASSELAKAAQIRFDNLSKRHTEYLRDEYSKEAAKQYALYLHHKKAAEILINEITK